jgi:hypothetical protein
MASEVSICNIALQLIKHSKQITSLTSGTKEANAAELVYDEMRDLLLDMHHWNFATRRVQLGQLSADSAPAFEWDHAYQLPADFIRVMSVHEHDTGDDMVAYKIEGDQILADADEIYLRYVGRVEDPNKMPPTFRRALSKLVAAQLATALSSSVSLSKELFAQFHDQDLPFAKSTDAIQNFADQLPESSFISARFGGGRSYEPGDPPS